MKKHYCPIIVSWVIAIACALALTQKASGQMVRLHGSISTAKALESRKAALESASGAQIEIVGNGAGRGLQDVSSGQAEVALLSGPLKLVAEALNKEKSGSVDAAQLNEIPLSNSKLGFYSNPAAGVKSVTDAQLRDVLTGKITNWKDVGGADLPIKVVMGFGADGVRVTVQDVVCHGAEYAQGAIVRNSSKDLPMVVSQLPGACAVLVVSSAEGNIAKVATETELMMPVSLVVKGEPSGDVKKVIDAIKAVIK